MGRRLGFLGLGLLAFPCVAGFPDWMVAAAFGSRLWEGDLGFGSAVFWPLGAFCLVGSAVIALTEPGPLADRLAAAFAPAVMSLLPIFYVARLVLG